MKIMDISLEDIDRFFTEHIINREDKGSATESIDGGIDCFDIVLGFSDVFSFKWLPTYTH